jgi:hypothetical protein
MHIARRKTTVGMTIIHGVKRFLNFCEIKDMKKPNADKPRSLFLDFLAKKERKSVLR